VLQEAVRAGDGGVFERQERSDLAEKQRLFPLLACPRRELLAVHLLEREAPWHFARYVLHEVDTPESTLVYDTQNAVASIQETVGVERGALHAVLIGWSSPGITLFRIDKAP
jgi:hypothetical protein